MMPAVIKIKMVSEYKPGEQGGHKSLDVSELYRFEMTVLQQ